MRVFFGDARVPDKVWRSLTLSGGCWVPAGVVIAKAVPPPGRHRLVGPARRVWIGLTGEREDVDVTRLSCSDPTCANPRHFAVAGAHDLVPGDRPLRFCKRGHGFDRENVRTLLDGGYVCSGCEAVYRANGPQGTRSPNGQARPWLSAMVRDMAAERGQLVEEC